MNQRMVSGLAAACIGCCLLGCSATRSHPQRIVRVERSSLPELMLVKSRTSERGLVLTIPDVLFQPGKADLTANAERDLVVIAGYLKQHPAQRARIEGHTDSTGSPAANRDLSLRRGTSVQTFLLQNGVDPERLDVRGLGEQEPVASNRTAAGREKNRRVEIVMLKTNADTTARTDVR